MKSRLHLPAPENLSPEQRRIHDEVLQTRGNLHGPFLAWLLNPQLAQPAQELGAFCRYGTSLSLQESELLIILVAAHYRCAAEQQIHEPIALASGLPEQAVGAVRAARTPELATPRLRLLATLAQELLATKHLAPVAYEQGVAEFSEKGLVEVVAIIGYYAFVAYTLNAFDMSRE
jgi:4-carboxymuconolactone decarboxylase